MTKMEMVMICRTMIPLSGPAPLSRLYKLITKVGQGKGIYLQS
jgi:hypothetical protein